MKKVRFTSFSALAASAALASIAPSPAAIVNFNLVDYQTIDVNGLFPATGSNNIDKFDTAGSSAGTVAPLTTTAYARIGRSGTAANLPRRTRLFMAFNLAGLTTESITSATLEFSAYSLNDDQAAANNAAHVWISQLTNAWASAGSPDPVYNPATTGTSIDGGAIVSGTQTDLYDGGFGTTYRNVAPYSIDVTSIVQNWQGGAANNGFLLSLGSSSSHLADAAHDNGLGINAGTVVLRVDAIPEPSSLGLLGLAGLSLLARRRRAALRQRLGT